MIELKMRSQHKVMWKANLTSCMVVFWLASLAMPVAAQQLPATPDAVRKALTSPAPTKSTEGAKPASSQAASAPAPKQAQTPKPAPPTSSANTPAPKPATASAPTSPAGAATSSATAKPVTGAAGNAKPAADSAAKPASGAIAGSKPAPAPAKPTANVKPAGLGSKVPAGTAPSAPKPRLITAAKSDVPNAAPSAVLRPVAVRENIARRDPFSPLIGKETAGGGGLSTQNLPPGKPGLLISSLRIDGIVSGPNGMIAIVSNAQDRVYFLREGDRLYDGQVQHITMDGISFHQTGKDPFGNAVEREVAKRLNSTPGEQQ
jgi:hypothetical protein